MNPDWIALSLAGAQAAPGVSIGAPVLVLVAAACGIGAAACAWALKRADAERRRRELLRLLARFIFGSFMAALFLIILWTQSGTE